MDDYARSFSQEEREKLAKQGKALPDGSFPIVTVQDLKNAIQAYGRAKNKAAAKRHIKKRARALGKTSLLPDAWKNGDSAMDTAFTFSEIRSLVSSAVRGLSKDAFVVDISNDWVVFDRWDETAKRYVLVKTDYTVDEGGAVSLSDDHVEVIRTAVYVPAPKQDSAASLLSIWGAALATQHAVEPRGDEALTMDHYHAPKSAVNGSKPTDLPHEFAQAEGSHPFFCSDCGRSKTHPLHADVEVVGTV